MTDVTALKEDGFLNVEHSSARGMNAVLLATTVTSYRVELLLVRVVASNW